VTIITALLLLFLSLPGQLLPAGGPPPGAGAKANEYVRYSASLDTGRVTAGSTARLLLRLQPKKGIHVNLVPPLSLTLDSLPPALSAGKLSIPKRKEYLDASQPISQTLRVSPGAPPGTVNIRGMLTYYYCSDAEGWCSRYRQPVELTLTIVK
jgi:hypothetical protein